MKVGDFRVFPSGAILKIVHHYPNVDAFDGIWVISDIGGFAEVGTKIHIHESRLEESARPINAFEAAKLRKEGLTK